MPGIWNSINGGYNADNNKKISSKLTFNVGEKFSGKVSKKGEGNEATIKLSNGWEFNAEIEGDLEGLEQGFKRFEVVGHNDGKLKLKLVNSENNSSNSGVTDDELGQIIKNEGLEKADSSLLKAMLKYDIPLSKDNIRKIKSLIDVSVRVNNNPKEIDKFIEKYLNSKNIDVNSQKGEDIKAILKDFLNSFKNMSKEDMLLFIENDIEFNKGNIDGYNKLNNGELTSKNLLEIIKTQSKNAQINISSNSLDEFVPIKEGVQPSSSKINDFNHEKSIVKEGVNSNINKDNIEVNTEKIINGYETQGSKSEKIDLLGMLKELSGKSDDTFKGMLKDIINVRKDQFPINNLSNIIENIESLDTDMILEKIITNGNKETVLINNDGSISKNQISEVIKNISKESIEKILSNAIGNEILLNDNEFAQIKDILNSKVNNNQDIFQKEIVFKDIIPQKEVVGQENINENTDTMLKNNISWEINDRDTEIIKDAVKNSAVRNLADIKSDNQGSVEQIKASIKENTAESKDILKNLLNTLKSGGESAEKLAGIIKNSINEINVLNKISNEYYYMDTPVKIRDHEYPCKLIVKDDRKSGKKIDSTNIRMVVTVKTINLGTVDGYLKVKDKNIDLELKSEEEYINILANGRQKLIDNISKLGFNINIKVTKKEKEVTLTNCREFFKDDNRLGIDFKV